MIVPQDYDSTNASKAEPCGEDVLEVEPNWTLSGNANSTQGGSAGWLSPSPECYCWWNATEKRARAFVLPRIVR